jgi:hypothetical protein
VSPFVQVGGVATTQQYGVTALTVNPANFQASSTWRFGRRFTVGGTDLSVDTLRIYAKAAATYRVVVHRQSDGATMATSDIVVGAGEVDAWKEAAVAPVTLVAATQYVVSARSVGTSQEHYRNPTSVTYHAAHTHNDYRYAAIVDTIPTSTTSSVTFWCDIGWTA